MTGHFILTPRARADLDEIWDYTVDRWSINQAETHTRKLWSDIAAVADRPSLEREYPEVRRGYRKYPTGSHVLFYRVIADGIDVVRIMHERMDYERYIL